MDDICWKFQNGVNWNIQHKVIWKYCDPSTLSIQLFSCCMKWSIKPWEYVVCKCLIWKINDQSLWMLFVDTLHDKLTENLFACGLLCLGDVGHVGPCYTCRDVVPWDKKKVSLTWVGETPLVVQPCGLIVWLYWSHLIIQYISNCQGRKGSELFQFCLI